MYSGTTLTAASGRLVGAHQKIDRAARRHVTELLRPAAGWSIPHSHPSRFPSIKTILHFEGRNGPDGIKRKSPAKDEPWHYFSPFNKDDTSLVELIDGHYDNLVKALAKDDMIVAAFEAAWLAHAVVDGLTPAHHYPYEEKLDELRGGLGKESRVTYKDKLVMPGDGRRDAFKNNWKMWGPKGLFTTHLAFEWGVSSILLPMRLTQSTKPTAHDIHDIETTSVADYFRRVAQEVAALGMYDNFYERGWTARLAKDVRQQLVPAIVKAVALIWYKAACDAGLKPAAHPGRMQ